MYQSINELLLPIKKDLDKGYLYKERLDTTSFYAFKLRELTRVELQGLSQDNTYFDIIYNELSSLFSSWFSKYQELQLETKKRTHPQPLVKYAHTDNNLLTAIITGENSTIDVNSNTSLDPNSIHIWGPNYLHKSPEDGGSRYIVRLTDKRANLLLKEISQRKRTSIKLVELN